MQASQSVDCKSWPGDEFVGDGAQQDGDADQVTSAVPHDRIPVQVQHLVGCQGTDGNDQGDVEDGRPDHSADSDVILRNISARSIRK